mmetsp:Transcript_15909/g.15326  ORF Transcript_15909/g.15326 Transcript_15909/m.15326 type:complete len:127 (+) Transcript_15909:797-1177(+)
MKQGKIFYFFGQNLLQMIETFEENNLQSQLLFHPNGKLLREAHYVDWALDGIEKCYYPDGNCYKQSEYQNGQCHGTTIYYNTGGEVDCLLEFEKGEVVRKYVMSSLFSALDGGGEENDANDQEQFN